MAAIDIVDDRADERPVIGIARIELHGDLDPRDARGGVGDAMNRIGMRDRADQRNLIHDLRQSRKPIADIEAGHVRGDAAELAPNFERSIGLGVECLELAG
jgi:hypothetical protein